MCTDCSAFLRGSQVHGSELMFNVICKDCGKEYHSDINRNGYCEECRSKRIAKSKHKYYESRKGTRADIKDKLTACEQCGRLFDAKMSSQKLCSICQLLKERNYRMTSSNQYRKDNQDVIQIKVPKGMRDDLKKYAASRNMSLTSLIRLSLELEKSIYSLPQERIDRITELITAFQEDSNDSEE